MSPLSPKQLPRVQWSRDIKGFNVSSSGLIGSQLFPIVPFCWRTLYYWMLMELSYYTHTLCQTLFMMIL